MEEVLEVLQIKRFAKRYRHQKAFCSMQMNILVWLFCEIDKTESQNSRALQNEIRFTWQWFQIKTLKRTPWHYNVTLVLINQHELVRWRMGQTCFPQRMVCLLQRTIHPGVCSRALCIEPNRLRKKVIDGCWWRVVLETFLDGAGNPPFIHDFPSETAISWGRDPQLGRHGRRLAAGRRRRPKLVEFLRGWLHGLKEKIGFPWRNHVKSLLSGQKPTVSTSHWWVSRGGSDIFVRAGTNISISQELYQELCAQRRWTFACPFCWISRLVKCDSRAYQSVPSWLARLAHRKSLEHIWIWDDSRVRLCYLPKKSVSLQYSEVGCVHPSQGRLQ